MGPLLRSRARSNRLNFGNGLHGLVGTGSPSFTPEGNDDLAEDGKVSNYKNLSMNEIESQNLR